MSAPNSHIYQSIKKFLIHNLATLELHHQVKNSYRSRTKRMLNDIKDNVPSILKEVSLKLSLVMQDMTRLKADTTTLKVVRPLLRRLGAVC